MKHPTFISEKEEISQNSEFHILHWDRPCSSTCLESHLISHDRKSELQFKQTRGRNYLAEFQLTSVDGMRKRGMINGQPWWEKTSMMSPYECLSSPNQLWCGNAYTYRYFASVHTCEKQFSESYAWYVIATRPQALPVLLIPLNV